MRHAPRLGAWTIAIVLAGASSAPAWPAPADASNEWEILHDGVNHVFGTEAIPLHPAPGGFALAVVDGAWHLVPARLGGHVVADAVKKGAAPDVALVATPPNALMYLRLPGLVPGKVDTPDIKFTGVQHGLGDKTLALPFKGLPWRFETRRGTIYFTDGARRQEIDKAPGKDEAHSLSLVWAGDLDHDGRLDFITRHIDDEHFSDCVSLSSHAGPGELAGQVACVSLGG